jgi:hypothetical protein
MLAGNDGVGELLSLAGSRAPALDGANDTLQEIIDRFPTHELASIGRLVRATSMARDFKLIGSEGEVTVRKADVAEAAALVTPILDLAAVHQDLPMEAADATRARAMTPAAMSAARRAGAAASTLGFVAARNAELMMALKSPQMSARMAMPAADPAFRRRRPLSGLRREPAVTETVDTDERPGPGEGAA